MQLYLVERAENTKWDYDQYDSFVCWANSVEEARHLSPGGYYQWIDGAWHFKYGDGTMKKDEDHSWPDHPDTLRVFELSRAPAEPTVVLGSFNAG